MAKGDIVTTTDYADPYRPVPIRVFNYLGRSSRSLGLSGSLNADDLVQRAKRKTGLVDLGNGECLEALEVLVKSINSEAELTSTGRLLQKSRLASALVHRLRIEELMRKHPEITDLDLGPIILVTGLQRTGTTLLHRLLSSHPGIRGVSGAELLEPVAARGRKGRGRNARKLRSEVAQRTIAYLSPQFVAVHPIDHSKPEEDILLLDLSFMSQSPEATMHVPEYSRWLEDQDHARAYAYLHRVLKVLCWQSSGTQWVLKTPHHMEYMDVFLRTFPNAKVLQTHRDPRTAFASFCSMVAHARAIFSDRVSPKEIALHWYRKTRRMVQVTEAVRAQTDADRFIDVSYYDLVQKPMAELQRIYQRLGIEFEGEAARNAESYIKANPQYRFGRHSYSLADFGMSDAVIDEGFSSYRDKYAIPFE